MLNTQNKKYLSHNINGKSSCHVAISSVHTSVYTSHKAAAQNSFACRQMISVEDKQFTGLDTLQHGHCAQESDQRALTM